MIPYFNKTIPAGLCKKCKFDLIPELYKETEKAITSAMEYMRKLFE